MTDHPVKRRKKLIEVAIPLEAINAASAREKSIRHGHPSTLHLWWARRPLAAARAVIFCQMVDDPSAVPEEFPTEEAQEHERLRLFALISELVTWENTTNEVVLERARAEIRRSWRRACTDNADHPEASVLFNNNNLPGLHDPFSGGGSIPLEAQRLGLAASGSDLNPVAVTVSKATYELPSQYIETPLCSSMASAQTEIGSLWQNPNNSKTTSLAIDVAFFGKLLHERVSSIISCNYPSPAGCEEKVLAWLWTRTVPSPNPSFSGKETPLLASFVLSAKNDNPAYLEIDTSGDRVEFQVKPEHPVDYEAAKNGLKTGRGANFRCVYSGDVISPEFIRNAAANNQMDVRLIAVVADAGRRRKFYSPDSLSEKVAKGVVPTWVPDLKLASDPRNFWAANYGLDNFGKLFSPRQLLCLNTFSDQLSYIRSEVISALMQRNGIGASDGGVEEASHTTTFKQADIICTYLALALSRLTDIHNACCVWDVGPVGSKSSTGGSARTAGVRHLFGRQTIPIAWDYAESNPISQSGGSFMSALKWVCAAIGNLPAHPSGHCIQMDARTPGICSGKIVSTDPPYYDNIAYADLSDFFYVWLRRGLGKIYPEILSTVSTPKIDELIAAPYRHGNKEKAEEFFIRNMREALGSIVSSSNKAFPVTIYYAFKQSEKKKGGDSASTGWEAFLQALTSSGVEILATWPIRTELGHRMIASGTNALASSVVLVCQDRSRTASTFSRSDFRRQLRQELPKALKELERANIAPVDVAQAAIGPGMAIFSSAKAVLNPDDSPMSVREALIEINAALDEYLSTDEGDLDADSRFALTFFESFGYKEREFGDAEGLAKARNLSVDGVAKAGILSSVAGKVQLLQRSELPGDWDPAKDKRLCVWEATQHLIKRLESSGEGAAAELLLQLKSVSGHGDLAANCRALAYRLYNHCEKKKQAEEARAYNGLVIAWPELERLASASSTSSSAPRQTTLI